MKLVEIRDAIFKKLSANFPASYKLYGEEIKQGFTPPCFFVQIIPITSEMLNKFHIRKLVNVDIHYFSENQTNIENLEMVDQLTKIFNSLLVITEKTFIPQEITYRITNGILHFIFDLEWTDALDETEVIDYKPYELMGELNMKEEY